MFHGLGTYFGAYPRRRKESCPWVTSGIFKYTGTRDGVPRGPGAEPGAGAVELQLGCVSWQGASVTYGAFGAGGWEGGLEMGEHICSTDESCKVMPK